MKGIRSSAHCRRLVCAQPSNSESAVSSKHLLRYHSLAVMVVDNEGGEGSGGRGGHVENKQGGGEVHDLKPN